MDVVKDICDRISVMEDGANKTDEFAVSIDEINISNEINYFGTGSVLNGKRIS
jgi:ABC-type methionine transport system ATPase subunit